MISWLLNGFLIVEVMVMMLLFELIVMKWVVVGILDDIVWVWVGVLGGLFVI